MSNLNKYLSREDIENIAIYLSKYYTFDAWDIKQSIEQLNSVDDTLMVLHEATKGNISLNQAVYLKLKGKDELK